MTISAGSRVAYKPGTVLYNGEVIAVGADGKHALIARDGSTSTQHWMPVASLTDLTPPPVVTPPPTSAPYPTWKPGSPWTTPIPDGTPDLPSSAAWITAISRGGPLTCDPDQYAGPIYRFSGTVPLRTIVVSGSYNEYDLGDTKPRTRTVGAWGATDRTQIPIPDSAFPSEGSDGHVILTDGVWEYGFWQFERQPDGTIQVTNGYRVPLGSSYGSFRDGKSGRGSGNPYGAGIIRKEDLLPGAPLHALAIPANTPTGPNGSSNFFYPAAKTDGAGPAGGFPEGARLQLAATFDHSGLHPVARYAARCLKACGGFIVDNSGSTKIYVEDRLTAGWDAAFTRSAVSGIPWGSCRFVAPPAVPV